MGEAGPDLAIHLAPIAKLQHKDAQRAILDLANHPEVAHPVAPQPTQWAGERLPGTAWIFAQGDPLIHEVEDAPGGLLVELA